MKSIRALFFMVFVLSGFNAGAQEKTVDAILAMPDDTAKVTSLVNYSKKILSKQPALADSLADIGLAIANKLNFSLGKAKLFYIKGSGQHTIFENVKAIEWFEKSKAVYYELKMPVDAYWINLSIALSYSRLGEYKKADSLSFAMIKYAEEIRDTSMKCSALISLSASAGNRNDYNSSLKYSLEAADLNEKINDKRGIAKCLNNIGVVLKMQKKYKEAIEYYNKSIALNIEIGEEAENGTFYNNIGTAYKYLKEYDKSLAAFRKAIQLNKKYNNFKLLASSYLNLALMYHKKPNMDSAMFYMRKSLEMSTGLNNIAGMAIAYSSLADWYFELNEFEKCRIHVDSCESLAIKSSQPKLLITVNELRAKLKAKNNKMKEAYDDLQKSIVIKDSIYNLENSKQIEELMARYETEKKDKEIAENKVQMSLKEIELTKKSNANRMLVAGVGILVLLVIFGSVSFMQRQKLQNRKKEIEKQKALEQTRAAIARDLHDDIGATLSSVQIMSSFASTAIEGNTPDAKLWVQKIGDNTGDILQNIRDIVWTMNPENDKAEELILRMKHFAAQMLEPKNIRYTFDSSEDVAAYLNTLPAKRNVFLIFKEAVNNAAKYSSATEMKITLEMDSQKCVMKITDNGKGFGKTSSAKGNGIGNMDKRALELKGTLAIVSAEGKGTGITLTC